MAVTPDPGSPVRRRLLQFLERQTGQRFGDDLDRWRTWLWSRSYEPHPDYAALKRAVYGELDPRMRAFFPDGVKSDMLFVRGFASDPNDKSGRPSFPNTTVQGLPLIKPPYGRITALDLNKGDLVWQIAHGETPDNIKNHAALKGLNIPRTGRQGRIGVERLEEGAQRRRGLTEPRGRVRELPGRVPELARERGNWLQRVSRA